MKAVSFDEILDEVERFESQARQKSPLKPSTQVESTGSSWLPAMVDFRQASLVSQRPVDYIINNLLIAGRAANLTGIGGSSKTTLLLMLAVQVALGENLLGWDIKRPGHALLLLAEETAEDIQRLFASISFHLNLSDEQIELLCTRLHVRAAAGYNCRLVDKMNPEQSHERLASLVAECKQLGEVTFIGLDPAIALSGGRELDELDQRELAMTVDRPAIETKAAVVLVSHAPKASQYQKEIGSHNTRGSGALTDALRLEMLMRVMTSNEARRLRIPEAQRHSYVRFQVTKANRLAPEAMAPRWFERKEAGILFPASIQGVDALGGTEVSKALLSLFLTPGSTTGELKLEPLSFASLKGKLLTAKIVSSPTPAGQEAAARRVLNKLRDDGIAATKSKGLWGLTAEGAAMLSGSGIDDDDDDSGLDEETQT